MACGQDGEGLQSEVRLVHPQKRTHAEGAKEVGLCPRGHWGAMGGIEARE